MQTRSRPSATAPQMTPTYASALVQRYMRSSMTGDADADSSESPGSSRGKPSPSPSPEPKKPALARRASNIIRAAASSSDDDESPERPAASAHQAAAQQARSRGGEPRLSSSQHGTAARRDSARQPQAPQRAPARLATGQLSNPAARRLSAAVSSPSRASAPAPAARLMSSPPTAYGGLDARRGTKEQTATGMQQAARSSSAVPDADASSSSRTRILSPSPPQKAPPPGSLSPRSSAMLVLQQRMQQRQQATQDRGSAAPEQPPLPLQQQKRLLAASGQGTASIRPDDLVAQQLRDITQSAATAIARARGTSVNAAGALRHAAAATVALARTGRLDDRPPARQDPYAMHRQERNGAAGDSGRPSSPSLPPPNVELAREAARRVSSPSPGTLWALGNHSPGSQAPGDNADADSNDDDDALRDLPGYGDGRRPSRRSRQQAQRQQQQQQETVQQEPAGSAGHLQQGYTGVDYGWEQVHDAAAGAYGEGRVTAGSPSSWQMEGRRLSATGEATAAALAAATATARRRSSMHEGAASPTELAAAAVSCKVSAALAAAAATAQAAAAAVHVSPGAGVTAETAAQHRSNSADGSSSESEEERLPGNYRRSQMYHSSRPSGFQSPELVKQRSSRHSAKQDLQLQAQQQQQRHRSRSPLSRQHGTSLGGHPAGTSPPNSPVWHAERGSERSSSTAAAAAATADDGHAQRSKHKAGSSGRTRARQPVPRFDDSQAPFDRHSHGTAADVPGNSSSAGLLFTSSLHQPSAASTRTGSTTDRVLKQLLDEGIDQTPVAGRSSGRMHLGAGSGSSGGSSPSGSASDGHSSGSSGGSRCQRRADSQQQHVHGQADQQHAKDERVLVERTALQAARRAASPVRMRRCSSPDVADTVVSAAAASAAAAVVAEQARQHQAGPLAGADHRSYRNATRARDTAGSSARRAASAMELTEEQQHKARLAEMLDSQTGRAAGLYEAPRLLPGLVGAPLPSATPLLMRHSGSRRYVRSGASPGAGAAAARTSYAAGVGTVGFGAAATTAAAVAASRPAWQQRSLSAGRQGSRYPSSSTDPRAGNAAFTASYADGMLAPSNISPPGDWPSTAGGSAGAGGYNTWQQQSNVSPVQPQGLSSDAVAAAAGAAAGGYVDAGYYGDVADKYAAQAQGLQSNLYVDTQGLRTPGLSDRPISPLRLQEYRAAAAGRASPDSPRHKVGLPAQPGAAAAAAAAAFDSYMQQQHWQQQAQPSQRPPALNVQSSTGLGAWAGLPAKDAARGSGAQQQQQQPQLGLLGWPNLSDPAAAGGYPQNRAAGAWQQQQQGQQQQSASLLGRMGSAEQQRLSQVLQFDSPAKAQNLPTGTGLVAADVGYQVAHYQQQSHAAAAAATADRHGTQANLEAGLGGDRSSTPGRDKSSSRNRSALIPVDDIVTAMRALHGQQQTSPRSAAVAAVAAAGLGAFQAAQQLGGEATLAYPGIEGSGSLGALGYGYSPPRQVQDLRGFSGFSSQQQQQQQLGDSPTLPPGSRGMGAEQLQSPYRPLQQLTYMQALHREPGARYSTQQQQQQEESPPRQQQQVSSPGPQELGQMLAGVVQSVQGLDSMMASLMTSAAQRSPSAAAPTQQQNQHQQQLLPGQRVAAQEQHPTDLQQPETATAAWLQQQQHQHQHQHQQQQPAFSGSEDMLLMGSVVPATRTHAFTPAAATAYAPVDPAPAAAVGSQQGTPQRVFSMALQGASSSAGPSPAAVVTAAAASVRRAMEELRVSAVSGWQHTSPQQQQQQQLGGPPAGAQQPFQLPSAGGNPEAQCSAAGGGGWGGHGAERDWGGRVSGQQQQQQLQHQQAAGSTQGVGSDPVTAQALHGGGVPRNTEEMLQSRSQLPGGGSQQGPSWGSADVAPKPQAQPSSSSPAGQGLVRALFTEGRPSSGPGDAGSNTLVMQLSQQPPQSQQQQQQQQVEQQPQQHQELLQYLTRLESQVLSLQQQVLLNQWAQQATSDGGSTHTATAAASPQQGTQQQGQLGRVSSEVQASASPVVASPAVQAAAPALGRAGSHTTNEAGAVPAAAIAFTASAAIQPGSPQGAAAEAREAGAAAAEEEVKEETSEAQPLLDSLAQQVLQLQNSLRAMLAPEGSSASQQQQLDDEAWQEEDHPVSQQGQQQQQQQWQKQVQGQPQQPGHVVQDGEAAALRDLPPVPALPLRDAAASTAASSPGQQQQQQQLTDAAEFTIGVPGAFNTLSAAVSPDKAAAAASDVSPDRTSALFAAAAAAAPVSPNPGGHHSRAGSTAGSLAAAAAAAGAGVAAGATLQAGSGAVLQRLTDMEVSMLANAHGLQALQDRLTKLEQRPAQLPQQQQAQDAEQQQQQQEALTARFDMLAQQVQGLQGVGADVSTAAATAAAAQTAAERAAAAASEAAAAAVAAGQVVQQQEAAVIAAVEQRMQAAAAAVQDSVGAKLTALESSHLQLQQEAVGFAGQLQQLQEQQQVLLANQDMLLARQQEQGGDLDAGRALQQQLADRLQGLEPLQQQVRVLQEGEDAHAAAGCAAADASAAAAAAACDEVGRVREEVRGLATKVEGLQQQLQQREDEGKGSAGDDLGVLSRDVAALQEQLQGVQGAVTALQEQQQQQAGSHIPSVQQQEQQLAQQQAQQRLGAEVAVLSGRVGELAAELAACSEAVSLTLPLRLVEVEDRVAATAQTCAEAVKVIALKHTNIGAMFAEVQTHQAAASTRIGQLSQQLASLRAARASKAASSSRHASSEGSM